MNARDGIMNARERIMITSVCMITSREDIMNAR